MLFLSYVGEHGFLNADLSQIVGNLTHRSKETMLPRTGQTMVATRFKHSRQPPAARMMVNQKQFTFSISGAIWIGLLRIATFRLPSRMAPGRREI